MNPDQEKIIEKLAKSVETAYNSPGKMFWRGLMWGLGRGVGNVIGFLLLLAILFYLFRITGLEQSFRQLLGQLQTFGEGIKNLAPR